MKTKNKYGFSIIFLFFLISLVISFGLVVINKQNFFEKEIEFMKINEVLVKNIITQGNIALNSDLQNNGTGGTYRPFLSCPGEVNYFSGTQIIATGSTSFQDNMCVGNINGQTLKLYHNSPQTTFSNGELDTQSFTLVGTNSLSGVLSLTGTIQFLQPIEYDTRFVNARMEMNGIIFKNTLWNSIFWNHKDLRKIIDENSNNITPFPRITQVSSGLIYLDVNSSVTGVIVEFNRDFYNEHGKLLKVSEFPFSLNAGGIGYIKNNATISSGTTNAKEFNFKDNDYAIFLSYENGIFDNMRYQLKIYDKNTGRFSYFSPIKDDTSEIEYMGGSVLINGGEYYSKIYKVSDYKEEILNNICKLGEKIPCILGEEEPEVNNYCNAGNTIPCIVN